MAMQDFDENAMYKTLILFEVQRSAEEGGFCFEFLLLLILPPFFCSLLLGVSSSSFFFILTPFHWDMIKWQPSSFLLILILQNFVETYFIETYQIRWQPSFYSSSSSPWFSSPLPRGRRSSTSCSTSTRTWTRRTSWRSEGGGGWWEGGRAGSPCSPAAPSPGRSAPPPCPPPPPPPPPPPTSKSSDQSLNKFLSKFLSNLAKLHCLVNIHHHTGLDKPAHLTIRVLESELRTQNQSSCLWLGRQCCLHYTGD